MEEEAYLELCLDQRAAQGDLTLPGSPQLSPTVPDDVFTLHPSNPEIVFSSLFKEVEETSGSFSSVNLSFPSGELIQENKDQTVIRNKHEIEDSCETQSQPLPSEQDVGLDLHSSSWSNSHSRGDAGDTGDADSVQPSLEKSNSLPLASITPMTSMTSVSECSGIVPQLQNVVSTVNVACKLDLRKIALHARNVEYNPKLSPHFISVFRVCPNLNLTAKEILAQHLTYLKNLTNEEQSQLAARKFARVIQKLGFPARFLNFKIQNLVGSCDVRFPIRLEGLVLTHQQFSSYEPELFPGLIYRMVNSRVVLLIFASGKVVLTGAKERSEIYEAFEKIYPILKNFEKA